MSRQAHPSSDGLPEALSTFDKTAKNAGVKPADQTAEPTPDTEMKPGDPRAEQRDAAEILRGGAEGDTAAKDAAIARRREQDKRSG